MLINIENRQKRTPIDKNLLTSLKAAIELCIEGEAPQYNFEMSLIFVSNEAMRKLNRQFRNIDKVTDVLSFPLLDGSEGTLTVNPGDEDMENGMLQLGDVVIAPERALEQANEMGHGLEKELLFLVIHGVLHLLGYDHEKEDGGKMLKRQEMYLQKALEKL